MQAGAEHVAYVLDSAERAGGRLTAMVAYTTSKPWDGPLPLGVILFPAAEAAMVGQARAFVMDLRRLAYLPVTPVWFPRLGDPGCGVLGRASKSQRDRFGATVTELAVRHAENLEHLGPLWRPGE